MTEMGNHETGFECASFAASVDTSSTMSLNWQTTLLTSAGCLTGGNFARGGKRLGFEGKALIGLERLDASPETNAYSAAQSQPKSLGRSLVMGCWVL